MSEKILVFIRAFKNNWGKVLLFLLLVLVFGLALFPLDDLGDLVSTQVAKLTNNNVYVRFEKMGISIVPQPGVRLRQVYIETSNMSPVSAQELTLTPSLGGLLHKKPFGHFSAAGFMKGNVDVTLNSGQRTEDGRERFELNVTTKKMSLFDIREVVNLPIFLQGQLSMELKNAQIDPLFTEQPEADLNVMIENFELPASNLPTQMGPLTLPELKLGQVSLNGRLAGGRLNISNGTIGREGDEIFGNVKVSLGLTLQQSPDGVITPVLGAYTVDVDLRVKRSFQEKASLFLSFLESYKSETPEGAQYRFRLSAANPHGPPNMGALR